MLPYLGEKPAIFPLVLNSDVYFGGGGCSCECLCSACSAVVHTFLLNTFRFMIYFYL